MWCDLSPAISEKLDMCLPLFKRSRQLLADPAVTFLALLPESNSLVLKTAGQITPKSVAECQSFDRVLSVPPLEEMVLLKRALTIADVTHPISNTVLNLQKAIGGPNAVTNSLVGGALTGLGGYALGSVYDNLVPRTLKRLFRPKNSEDPEYFDRTNMAKTLGLLGAGVGSSYGLFRGGMNWVNGHSLRDSFLGSHPWHNSADELLAKKTAVTSEDICPEFTKAAELTGGLFVPSIPVDAFNRAVWSNVGPQNPFGTRNAWGDNTQPMTTPPQVASIVGGLVSAAGAAKGSGYVSPWDVAQVTARAGINAGLGAVTGSATGLVAGKVLGALAGLTPPAQQYLQRAGLWSGLLTGVAKSIF